MVLRDRIVPNRLLELLQAVLQRFPGSLVPEIASAQVCLIRAWLDYRGTLEPGLGLGAGLILTLVRYCRCHVALDRQNVSDLVRNGVPKSLSSSGGCSVRDGNRSVHRVGPVISLAFDSNNGLWITTAIGGSLSFQPWRVESTERSPWGKTYVGPKNLTLPAHTDKLEIDYTALSLAIPERVLFRYMRERKALLYS